MGVVSRALCAWDNFGFSCFKWPSDYVSLIITLITNGFFMMAKYDSSRHERATKKKFWVSVRNRTSDLRFLHSDVLLLSPRDSISTSIASLTTTMTWWPAVFLPCILQVITTRSFQSLQNNVVTTVDIKHCYRFHDSNFFFHILLKERLC